MTPIPTADALKPDHDRTPAAKPRRFASRSSIELIITAIAILLGAAGVLLHSWALDYLGVLVGSVGLGIALFRWLTPDASEP